MKELLTRTECTAMRGIAILAIILHNYCHYVKGIVKENEYQFFDKRIDGLWEALTSPDEFLPMHLMRKNQGDKAMILERIARPVPLILSPSYAIII